jgi:hypothetical protein
VADRLQIAADRNPEFRPVSWPSYDLGKRFDDIVRQYLTTEEPPNIPAISTMDELELRDLWEATVPWRTRCLDEAREKTMALGWQGVRRGEIMNAVGRSLGFPPGHRVHDISELFPLVEDSYHREAALRYFFRWICDLYQYSQATAFGVSPDFPGYAPASGLLATSLLPGGESLVSVRDHPVIRETMSMPSLGVLRRVEPKKLLDIRDDKGVEYFAALLAWQRDPSEMNERDVRRALRSYCGEISKVAFRTEPLAKVIADVSLGSLRPVTSAVLLGLVGSAISFVSVSNPWVAPLIALGSTGYAVYCWVASDPEDVLFELPLARRTTNAIEAGGPAFQSGDS